MTEETLKALIHQGEDSTPLNKAASRDAQD